MKCADSSSDRTCSSSREISQFRSGGVERGTNVLSAVERHDYGKSLRAGAKGRSNPALIGIHGDLPFRTRRQDHAVVSKVGRKFAGGIERDWTDAARVRLSAERPSSGEALRRDSAHV